ncbi:hydroxymethylbilane synthase [Gulosibacter molinativorax]|uniref:Porphobilinogen deaminase n=1 Tax=Gulosibacter molinativorax TaxID=256821 RepID=A0ABT7CBE2_9MICO|nr:hydroxymethylbilane synthase [Gulosibacter molinativorax]MDJ1371956.1 hydroxymethylbilane synthase [Gulosibacter molinativorax]QUY62680.1 Porphobilinogen deaminase [Gulosibacter molinativorax]
MSATSSSAAPLRFGTPGDQPIIRIGTRGSKLAVAQTSIVAEDLARLTGREFEIIKVTTHGDVNRASLSTLGGQGVFATELREALLDGEVDIAVHSLKDLPTAPAPGLQLAAHPAREDARDAVVARDGLDFADLPHGAKVGTGSPRRRAQIRRVRPDLELRDIRGNVDTRIGFVTDGELDAVFLATAGLNRVGRTEVITGFLELEDFPTAPGQGALAIETREGWDLEGLRGLDDAATRAAADAERAILNGLDAGCQAPVGIHADVRDGVLTVLARVYGKDALAEARGEVAIDLEPVYEQSLGYARGEVAKQDYVPARLAAELVDSLFAQGAGDFIGE